jgi:hypothetical protein
VDINSDERKKERERFWLEMLQARLPQIASANVQDGERPDFVLTTERLQIGVEVTEYCQEGLERQDQLAERVCRQAEAECASLGLPPIWVQAEFDHKAPLHRRQISMAATDLAQRVQRLVPPTCPGQAEERRYSGNLQTFPSWLMHVWVDRWPGISKSQWSPIRATGVPMLTSVNISTILESKSSAVADYRPLVDETWLLYVVDGFRVARDAMLSESAKRERYVCEFDRVFVLWDRGNLDELRVSRPHA